MKEFKEILIDGYTFYQNEQGRFLVPETKEEFNNFTRVLFNTIKDPTELQIENYRLIKEFPFLLPKNRWDKCLSFEPDYGFDFTWTEIDSMPKGWFIAFGMKMINEIKEWFLKERPNFLYEYMITDIKEKYGSLRWYDYGAISGTYEIISKYEKLSEITCIVCGKPATMISSGWISPYCEKHGEDKTPISIIENGEIIDLNENEGE